MLDEIIGIYAISDDILKAIGHRDDSRRQMTDAEILTTALSATLFFHGNQETAREYMKDHGLIPRMLSKSRFNRRFHALADLMDSLFHQLGMVFKFINP